jgi:ABC-type transport system substrate-binding protein
MDRKLIVLLAWTTILAAGCIPSGTPVEVTRVVVERVEVTPEVEVQPEPERQSPDCCSAYRIGIAGDISTENIWNYVGPGAIVWNSYVLEPTMTSLFALSDQRFDFVPLLAADLPPEPIQEGDFWTIEVEMVDDALWSDGEPIDANDVAFTIRTCLALQLTGNWPTFCASQVLDHVDVLDEYSLKYFFSQKPGLAQWQHGVALAPILPEHFWKETVDEALEIVRGIEPPGPPLAAGATEDEVAAYEATASAYSEARSLLYEAEAPEHPSGGAYVFDKREPGAFAQTAANPNFHSSGAEIVQYEDGTLTMAYPSGRVHQLYGPAEGEEALRFTQGPFSPSTIFSVYPDPNAAYIALANDDIDLVLNPLGVPAGQLETATREGNVRVFRNPGNGFMYLGFNLRREPMSDLAFRQALELLIDKEFVAGRVLQNTVSPLDVLIPPGNIFWHNREIRPLGAGLTRSERLASAKEILLEADYTWEIAPEWDEAGEIFQRGAGLTMPNGTVMPELVLKGPSAASETSAASFAQWIEEWSNEFGIPLDADLAAFAQYVPSVFGAVDFDLYILGWGLSIYPDYLVDFFHSANDTATTGNFNSTGYSNPEFDSLGEEFEAETDLARAQELALQLQEFLARELPYIPLYSAQIVDIVRENVELPYTEVLDGLPGVYGLQSSVKVIIGN